MDELRRELLIELTWEGFRELVAEGRQPAIHIKQHLDRITDVEEIQKRVLTFILVMSDEEDAAPLDEAFIVHMAGLYGVDRIIQTELTNANLGLPSIMAMVGELNA